MHSERIAALRRISRAPQLFSLSPSSPCVSQASEGRTYGSLVLGPSPGLQLISKECEAQRVESVEVSWEDLGVLHAALGLLSSLRLRDSTATCCSTSLAPKGFSPRNVANVRRFRLKPTLCLPFQLCANMRPPWPKDPPNSHLRLDLFKGHVRRSPEKDGA